MISDFNTIVIVHTFTNLVIYYNGTKKSRIHATTIEPFKRDYETTYPYQNADCRDTYGNPVHDNNRKGCNENTCRLNTIFYLESD